MYGFRPLLCGLHVRLIWKIGQNLAIIVKIQLKSPKFLPGTAVNGPFSSTMAMNGLWLVQDEKMVKIVKNSTKISKDPPLDKANGPFSSLIDKNGYRYLNQVLHYDFKAV